MKFQLTKTLQLRRRGQAEWEPGRNIFGFREEGTDLIVVDKNNNEAERFQAGDYDGWKVTAEIRLIEP